MKKTPLIFSALLVIIVSACLTLAARERRGATVLVTMTDGSVAQGELLAVKSDALLIFNNASGLGRSFDLLQIDRVRVMKKSKALNGLAAGLEVGLAVSLYYYIRSDQHENSGLAFVTVMPITGLIGGILGALSGREDEFAIAGAPPEERELNLDALRQRCHE
jgi:hypothetical protein